MIACEHEFHALGVALLDDRLILPHAFEPFFDFPFAHHDVKPGHKARFRWIEGNLPLEIGLTKIEPSFWRLVRLDQIRIVRNSMFGPIPRRPAILRLDERLVLF